MTNKTLKIKKRKVSKSNVTKKARNGRKYSYKNDKNKKGGNPDVFMTINNNGYVKEGDREKYDQCFWISIRDYLNNFRCRQDVTVGQIKTFLGLDLSTDSEKFDLDTPKYRRAAEDLARQLNLRIDFYCIIEGRSFLTNHRNEPIPQTTINEGGSNIVSIGFDGSYGGHFELIIMGPKIVPLNDICFPEEISRLLNTNRIGSQRSKKVRPDYKLIIGEYTTKVLIDGVYVSFEDIEHEIKQLISLYDENNNKVLHLESQLAAITRDIAEKNTGLSNLKSLNAETQQSMNAVYKSEKEDLESRKTPLTRQISDIKINNDLLNELIGLKKRYVELRHTQYSLESQIQITTRQLDDDESGLRAIENSDASGGMNNTTKGQLKTLYQSSIAEKSKIIEKYRELLALNLKQSGETKDVIAHFEEQLPQQ